MDVISEANEAEVIVDHPSGKVSDPTQSSPGQLAQALIADQPSISMISNAILNAIRADISSELSSLSRKNPAEPLGQSVANTSGEAVDRTLSTKKRPLPLEVDVQVVENSPHTKRIRLDNDPLVSEHMAASCDLEDDPDGLTSPNSRWEPSEELDALLKVVQHPMPRFERRAIVKEFPRPASEPAFTPVLDDYLISMIQGVKTPDNSLRDMQDKILDVLGPLCTMYENINCMYDSLVDEAVSLDKASIVSMFHCIKKAIMLVGDTSAQLSSKRREQVITKLNPTLASLGKEQFPDCGKQLFGDGFEARLKLRSETANTVSNAKKAGKQFFRGTATKRFQGRSRGGNQSYRGTFRGFYRPHPTTQSYVQRGRGRAQAYQAGQLQSKPQQ